MTLSESDDSWVGVMYPYRVRNICYWHEQSALQSVTVKRSTGNNDSGPLFSSLFFSIFFPFSPFFHSPSQPFLKEGVLGSKTCLAKLTGTPKNLVVDHFPDPDPLVAILDF